MTRRESSSGKTKTPSASLTTGRAALKIRTASSALATFSPSARPRASAALTAAESAVGICHMPTFPLQGIGRSKLTTFESDHQ